jgi:hypothetical protein
LKIKINSISAEVNLIVLPEMFTTGFTQPAVVAETMKGKQCNGCKHWRKPKNAAITGSVVIEEILIL